MASSCAHRDSIQVHSLDERTRSQQPRLPEMVLSLVIEQAVESRSWRLHKCLQMRLVSRHFNQEVLRQLYTLFRMNCKISSSSVASYVDDLAAIRYWQAFVAHPQPDRSYQDIDQFPDPDIDRASQQVQKQRRRLRRIHTTLCESVDTMMSLVKAGDLALHVDGQGFDQRETADAQLRQACEGILSQAATCLLGPEFAWRFVHHQKRSNIYWAMHNSGRNAYDEGFYEQHLLAKPATFWVTLVAAYIGDTRRLKEHFESIRIQHRDTQKWMERLNTSYVDFATRSSAVERRWLEVLSACLTIGINIDDLDLVNFVLEQDPAVSMLAFQSIRFHEYDLLSLAIRRYSLAAMTALLNHSWLMNPNGKISRPMDYVRAIMTMAGLPHDLHVRDDMMLKLLGLSDRWQTTQQLQRILNCAVRCNDLRLVETIICNMTAKPAMLVEEPFLRAGFDVRDMTTPLEEAINVDSIEMVRLLLENSSALHLQKMTRDLPPRRDIRTLALLELLRQGLALPPQPRSPGRVNINILAALLEHSTDIHDQQVEAIVSDAEGYDLLLTFLHYVDLTAKVSTTTGLQVGEVVLATATARLDLRILEYLLEDRGYEPRITTTGINHPSNIPDPRPCSRFTYSRYAHWCPNQQDKVRSLLARHRLVFDDDSNTVQPCDSAADVPNLLGLTQRPGRRDPFRAYRRRPRRYHDYDPFSFDLPPRTHVSI